MRGTGAAPTGPARVVVLGAGTGGTIAANRLRRTLGDTALITVVDRDAQHVYQPGLLFVPFGRVDPSALLRPRRRFLHPGVGFAEGDVDHVDVPGRRVHLTGADGREQVLDYDVLVVATGAVLVPEETDGLAAALANGQAHTFYTLEAAAELAGALAGFTAGRLVVNVVDLPIKCPVAPLEFCFLADHYFRRRGIRDRVQLTYATPLDAAFTKPIAARALADLLKSKGVELVTEFNTGSVDGAARRLTSYDGRELAYDLAVVVPLHAGAGYVARSPGLGDALGFVPVDEHTLQSTQDPHVFALGDSTDLPASKAGSVAHFEGEVLAENVRRHLCGQALAGRFDGHTNCFIETGGGKALLIDFNYDTEPLPGHYPARIGLPLLRESRLNHLGKLAFEQLYWHALLPGRDLPGIGSPMPLRGKHNRLPAAAAAGTTKEK